MLSMGKLSHLAQLHDGETAINQDTLDGMVSTSLSGIILLIASSLQHSTMVLTS